MTEQQIFISSGLDGNKALATTLRELADWLEKSNVSLEHIVSHSEGDVYLFVVYYEREREE